MKEYKGDKRTKEYREWKKAQKTVEVGLGDVIENITEATGIKKAVKKVFGDDCGCEERKSKANVFAKFRKKECLTEEDYQKIGEVLNKFENPLPYNKKVEMILLHNEYFSPQENPKTSCGSCVRKVYKTLQNVYNFYIKQLKDD